MTATRQSLTALGARARVVVVLGLLVLLLHANALNAFFVGDDFDILRGVSALTSLDEALRLTFVGNWGPISYGQFYLNYRVGGFDPLIYHLTNLSWLGLAVVAVYGLVRSAWPEEPRAAWVAALLFLTHPLNDQAISYICARSHATGAALAMLSLCLYARWRQAAGSTALRVSLLVGSLLAGFLGGLSKESALTLPAWIAAYEWLFRRSDRESPGRSLLRALGAAVLFGLVALAVFGARDLAIGGAPPRLEAAAGSSDLWRNVARDLPVYVMLGGAPFPFGWIDLRTLARIDVLGWIMLGAAVAAGLACFGANAFRPSRSGKAGALFVLGLTVAVTSLSPVLVAGLELQRRYLFIANLGIVLMVLAVLEPLHRRLPRATRVLAAAMILCGAVGTVQRNDLYRRSGNVVKSLVETTFQAPVEELPSTEWHRNESIVLVTLPHYYGGDRASGAMLLHRTDLYGVIKLFGTRVPVIHFAMKCHHADDYSARAEFESDTVLKLTVSFRTDRAYRAALGRDLEADRRRDAAIAELISSDPAARLLTYRVRLADDFWARYGELLLYSDDRFVPLRR